MSDGVIMVYVTFANLQEAKRICRLVVEDGLAACANILGEGHSIYSWEGEMKEEAEITATLKTTQSQFSALKDKVVAEHSYETPCILSWPIEDGNASFLKWVAQQTDAG